MVARTRRPHYPPVNHDVLTTLCVLPLTGTRRLPPSVGFMVLGLPVIRGTLYPVSTITSSLETSVPVSNSLLSTVTLDPFCRQMTCMTVQVYLNVMFMLTGWEDVVLSVTSMFPPNVQGRRREFECKGRLFKAKWVISTQQLFISMLCLCWQVEKMSFCQSRLAHCCWTFLLAASLTFLLFIGTTRLLAYFIYTSVFVTFLVAVRDRDIAVLRRKRNPLHSHKTCWSIKRNRLPELPATVLNSSWDINSFMHRFKLLIPDKFRPV